MTLKTRLIISLAVLALLDMIIPVPFTALFLIYVIMEKPTWFRNYVDAAYQS